MALNLNRTVEELKKTMSFREFQEWQIYYNEEPFLADRIEIQLAKIGHITSLTGMGKIDIPNDFFTVSNMFKIKDKETEKDLAAQILTAFGAN